MARIRVKLPVRTYFIYDPGAKDKLGDIKIINDTVLMTEDQAAYWIRAGVIGTKQLDLLDQIDRNHIHQLSGGRVPLEAGGSRLRARQVQGMGYPGAPGKKASVTTVKNAVQDPGTMATAVITGNSPETGRQASSEFTKAERMSARSIQNVMSASEGLTAEEMRGTTGKRTR